jgi:hypothetical protein
MSETPMTARARIEGEDVGERDRAPKLLSSKSLALWFGVLGPPFAWAANLVLGDLIYELGCQAGMRRTAIFALSLRVWGVLQTAVLEVVIILAGLAAWRAWTRLRHLENGTVTQRAKVLAMVGVVSAIGYSALLLFSFVPQLAFFHDVCATSL